MAGEKMVTVQSFADEIDAYLAKAKLDVDKIDSWIDNANSSSLGPHYSMITGQVKLVVRKEDVERACKILDQQKPAVIGGNFDGRPCPQCGSENTINNRIATWAVVFAIFFFFPIAVFFIFHNLKKVKVKCTDCNNMWDPDLIELKDVWE